MVLEVRTQFTNVRLYPRRYFDVDSQKYVSDKCEKIRSFSLHEIIDDSVHNNMFYDASWKKLINDRDNKYDENGKKIEKWFTPPDDDWED